MRYEVYDNKQCFVMEEFLEMRRYEKPVMAVEKFTAKNAVATGCYNQTYTTIPAQTIKCVIEGSEKVFAEGTSGCTNEVSSGYYGYYNGTPYFVWYTGTQSTQATEKQTALLSAIEQAVGANSAIGKMGWHAGPVSQETYSKMNSTS